MADVLNWIITASKKNVTNLGDISQKVTNNIFNKKVESGEKSLFSSLTQFVNQDSSEYKEQLDNIKKKPILDKINNLYGDRTFSGRYGFDVIKVEIVVFLFMVAITYIQIQNKLLEVKQDWPQYRCRPDVMPFAGWINPPEDMSPAEYTAANFAQCSANTVKGIYEKRASMVYVIFDVVMKVFKKILDVIEQFRLLFDRMRNALKDIFITALYQFKTCLLKWWIFSKR